VHVEDDACTAAPAVQRIVFDMHEIFPEFARAKYPGILGATLSALARRVERLGRRRADLTITVNRPSTNCCGSSRFDHRAPHHRP